MSRSCPPNATTYTIRAGDTFYSLARRYNTTVDNLIALNPGVDPNRLQIGQTICVPATPPVTQCPMGTTPYVIRSGDTFFSIAQRNNITVEALIAANPGVDPNRLQIGQTICVPVPPGTQCPTGTTPYVIRSGDTFFSIAQRNNITVEALIAANPGVDPNRLQIGQTICIPTSAGSCPMGTTPYMIRAGDTFFSIAQRNNITVDALIAANPGVDPNRLQIGQTICIPTSVSPCPAGTTPYVIRAGDTFYSIARRFNVNLDRLLAANPGVDPDRLQIGQTICIPN